MLLLTYQRDLAVAYAHRWAYGRNPAYYDYENIGGDCTNFASQCIYAGTGVMNYTPDFGWYYISANKKAPAWTGVEFFYRFMTRKEPSAGPIAKTVSLQEAKIGDIIQISYDGVAFQHTPIIVKNGKTPQEILVASHSYDSDNRPLSTYAYAELRILHILGYYQ